MSSESTPPPVGVKPSVKLYLTLVAANALLITDNMHVDKLVMLTTILASGAAGAYAVGGVAALLPLASAMGAIFVGLYTVGVTVSELRRWARNYEPPVFAKRDD